MPDIKYEIIEQYGPLSEGAYGRRKELNLISWNEYEPKFDIREWTEDHQRMGKGVTLTREEAAALRDLLNSIDLP